MRHIVFILILLLSTGFSKYDLDNDGDIDGLDLQMFSLNYGSTTCSESFRWDSNTEEDLIGYRLYYGTVSREYTDYIELPKEDTSVTLSGLDCSVYYYFALTAYSLTSESEYSVELTTD